MPDITNAQARLTHLAEFPKHYFLENMIVRRDHSFLITAMSHKELWYVPPSTGTLPLSPLLLHTFAEPTTGIVEVEPDIFYLSTANLYTTHECFLHRLNLQGWSSNQPVTPEMVLRFPDTARGLNGSCLLAPGVVLLADCFASLIWRVDLPADGSGPVPRVWIKHESMGYFPGKMKPEQPGVNGVRFAAKKNYLFYTSTAKKLFMRIPVNPETLDPAGEPELVVAGRMGDDFCIDEDTDTVYLTTHRQNTIDRVAFDPGDNSNFTDSVAGDPYTSQLIGPSSGAWGRQDGDYGHVAYFIMDGGTASPPPDGTHAAALLRVELPPVPSR